MPTWAWLALGAYVVGGCVFLYALCKAASADKPPATDAEGDWPEVWLPDEEIAE